MGEVKKKSLDVTQMSAMEATLAVIVAPNTRCIVFIDIPFEFYSQINTAEQYAMVNFLAKS